jgi:hypothetical protein
MHVYYVWRYLRLVHMGMKKQCLAARASWGGREMVLHESRKKRRNNMIN